MWFWNYNSHIINDVEAKVVSVPLRGCGFEIFVVLKKGWSLCSFPSPYGDVVLKWYKIFWRTAGSSGRFRPLAGMWFWNYFVWVVIVDLSREVSVPLRGCGFEISRSNSTSGWEVGGGFRPLAGMWFWNDMPKDRIGSFVRFPSPCGDVVLKFLFIPTSWKSRRRGFRPLAGMWFWNYWKEIVYEQICRVVSVPLRGCGFEISLKRCMTVSFRSFRPLAGMWFWNNVPVWGESAQCVVSVPLRGCGFEIKETIMTNRKVLWFPSPCGDVVLK